MSARASTSPTGALDLRAVERLPLRRLAVDSRAVKPGDTFLAYPGETQDGRRYIAQAIAAGAGAVLWEARGYEWPAQWQVPNLGIRDLRRHAGEIAAHACGRPTSSLWVVGVTGTNGKTSCSQWIAQALTRIGRKCAVIGTVGSGYPGRLRPLVNTTPDGVWLQARMAQFLRRGAQAVSMEVSSIGLDQHRVAGVQFDVALLTNLTRDHLDYHGTMARYRAAKAKLFRMPGLEHAVLNLEDAFGAELARTLDRGPRVIGYGFERAVRSVPRRARFARITGCNLDLRREGVSFDVRTPWGAAAVSSKLIGRFNAVNLLGVLGALLASGVALDRAADAVARVKPAPGRIERHGGGRLPLAVIDYAHTPDALEQALRALREAMTASTASRRARGAHPGRLICVFGCGGDRDPGKRPMMGRVATRLADRVVVTSDNPRNENPTRIIRDILEGGQSQCEVEPDRERAIRRALRGAQRGDVVLIAGKGHEQYQSIRGVNHPFSDRAVVQAVLREMRA